MSPLMRGCHVHIPKAGPGGEGREPQHRTRPGWGRWSLLWIFSFLALIFSSSSSTFVLACTRSQRRGVMCEPISVRRSELLFLAFSGLSTDLRKGLLDALALPHFHATAAGLAKLAWAVSWVAVRMGVLLLLLPLRLRTCNAKNGRVTSIAAAADAAATAPSSVPVLPRTPRVAVATLKTVKGGCNSCLPNWPAQPPVCDPGPLQTLSVLRVIMHAPIPMIRSALTVLARIRTSAPSCKGTERLDQLSTTYAVAAVLDRMALAGALLIRLPFRWCR